MGFIWVFLDETECVVLGDIDIYIRVDMEELDWWEMLNIRVGSLGFIFYRMGNY